MMFITLGDIVGVISFVVLLTVVVTIKFIRRQPNSVPCNQDNFYENGACDAICCSCGKNLGFISNIRYGRRVFFDAAGSK